MTKTRYKTIFISDTHLGSRTANAKVLLDFLKHSHCDKLVIIGDFIDFWALKRSTYFPALHRDILRLIIKWSVKGIEIEYIPGNHDEIIRSFLPIVLDNVKILEQSVHTTVSGKRFLITHGDQFDQVMLYAKWLAWFGDIGYHFLIYLNHHVNFIRRYFGFGYWSLSAYIKKKVKSAVSIIGNYEEAVSKHVIEKGYDGVICGHIHTVEMKAMHGITYINCGDFVESCTAIVEDFDGNLQIIYAHETANAVMSVVNS